MINVVGGPRRFEVGQMMTDARISNGRPSSTLPPSKKVTTRPGVFKQKVHQDAPYIWLSP